MRHYATAAPSWQAAVLFMSMLRHCRPFTLHVLATDWEPPIGHSMETDGEVMNWRIEYTASAELVGRHPHLDHLPGRRRNPNEYNCSVRWRWFADLIKEVGPVMAVDGDMWFWSSPEVVWRELEACEHPWALTEHRFAPAARGLRGVTQESHGKFGRFNGGWAWFRDPAPAILMANHAEQWAYQGFKTLQDGRVVFGDQGWLEIVHEILPAHVLQHSGVNLAPWNLRATCGFISPATATEPPRLYREGPPWRVCDVVLYHYSSLKIDAGGGVVQHADPSYDLPATAVSVLYDAYLQEVRRCLTP